MFSGGVYLKLQGSKLDECRESMAERHWPNEKEGKLLSWKPPGESMVLLLGGREWDTGSGL